MVTAIGAGSEMSIDALSVLQLLEAGFPVIVTMYPAAVVVEARPVKVAVFAVVLVGKILVAAPSKEVISKENGPIGLLVALMVIVPSESPLQVTSVVVMFSTEGSILSGTVMVNSLLQAALFGVLVS
tara:strand:- start:34 stop:414 length:381 start_codon:yes stop_codon:yes gene_type:complete